MANLSTAAASHRQIDTAQHTTGAWLRSVVIGLTAFLTVVDLFATQAILPSLARAYNVSPAAMGFAVNASTMGMAFSGQTYPVDDARHIAPDIRRQGCEGEICRAGEGRPSVMPEISAGREGPPVPANSQRL